MRIFLFLTLSAIACAQSHPSWWSYASPEATALVGIRWDILRQSPFAEAVGSELSATGSLGLPDLDCLKQAKHILISSPALLVIESGYFPLSVLRDQAAKKGLRKTAYRGVSMWLPDAVDKPGVAYVDEQLVLIGARKTLESALDRSVTDSHLYSPLLASAARFAQSGDLWVVSRQLPDPLANLFVPIDSPALGFIGSVTVQNGLDAEASVLTASAEAAEAFAEDLRQAAPTLPAIARDLRVTTDGIRVMITLQASSQRLLSELREGAEGSAPAPALVPAPAPAPPKPTGPQVIRIFGLDSGPREIPFPAP